MHRIYLIILNIALFSSCILPSEDSLFEEGEQALVIEGRVTDSDDLMNLVRVTKSVSGDDEKSYDIVSNAVVRIVDTTTANSELLENIRDGYYRSNQLECKSLHQYKLEVYYDDGLYQSIEQMTQKPQISTIKFLYQNQEGFIPGYYMYFNLKKRVDTVGYYKVETLINDSLLNGYGDLLLFDDRLFTENQIFKLPTAFNINDKVTIRIFSLSEPVFDYFMALNKQTTNLFSNIQPPSTNPQNNIHPQVLGYFQASSVYIIDTAIAIP